MRLIFAAFSGAYCAAIAGVLLYAVLPPAIALSEGRSMFAPSLTVTIMALSPVLALTAVWITLPPALAAILIVLKFGRPWAGGVAVWAIYLVGPGLYQGELNRPMDWLVASVFALGCGLSNTAGFRLTMGRIGRSGAVNSLRFPAPQNPPGRVRPWHIRKPACPRS